MTDETGTAASDEDLLKQLVQTLDTGVAIVAPENWKILFENAKFFQWFPPKTGDDEPLPVRLEAMNADRARGRIRDERPYSFETEVQQGSRTVPLAIEFKRLPNHDLSRVVVECRNVSKQREAEYMLDSYSKMAERHARELEKEKERVEKLLLNIMPRSVYEEFKDYGTTTPQKFESASVLMLDFVGFTEMAETRDPTALLAELNDIFTAFDRIVDLFGCERIKTIGDAYLAVSGIPEPIPDHAHNIAKAALRMKRYLERRNAAHPDEWRCRIGINTGPLIGSMVGIQKYVYDIFGPGVNMAARMEGYSEPMGITLCDETYEQIKDEFIFDEIGEVEIKGVGVRRLYSLVGEQRGRP